MKTILFYIISIAITTTTTMKTWAQHIPSGSIWFCPMQSGSALAGQFCINLRRCQPTPYEAVHLLLPSTIPALHKTKPRPTWSTTKEARSLKISLRSWMERTICSTSFSRCSTISELSATKLCSCDDANSYKNDIIRQS